MSFRRIACVIAIGVTRYACVCVCVCVCVCLQIRGKLHWKANASYPSATVDESKRVIYAAMMKEMRVGYLPVHLFSNAYS